jgi:hypothetical protein
MDKFKNRIRYYLFGLGIGLIFVYFMFGNRGCSWLPGNRVKNMIGEKEIIVGDSVLAVMNCLDFSNEDVYEVLKSEGNVEFSKSITNERPKIYHIEGTKENKIYIVKFALYDRIPMVEEGYAEVLSVSFKKSTTDCAISVSNQNKSVLPLPHADVIAILEKNEFRVTNNGQCDLDFYGLKEGDVLDFHKSATINIEESQPRLSPNPIYILEGEMNNQHFTVKYVVGELNTRISNISGESPSDCEDL